MPNPSRERRGDDNGASRSDRHRALGQQGDDGREKRVKRLEYGRGGGADVARPSKRERHFDYGRYGEGPIDQYHEGEYGNHLADGRPPHRADWERVVADGNPADDQPRERNRRDSMRGGRLHLTQPARSYGSASMAGYGETTESTGGTTDETEFVDPDYLDWREQQLWACDNDYRLWRAEQSKKYDEEYRTWRATRREKFNKDFEAWRTRMLEASALSEEASTAERERDEQRRNKRKG